MEIIFYGSNYPVGRMTVPQFDFGRWFFRRGKNAFNSLEQIFYLAELVGSPGDGDRPFGVGPQRQARYSEVGGFLLNAAGIGNRQTAVENQIHEAAITQRFEQQQAPAGGQVAI